MHTTYKRLMLAASDGKENPPGPAEVGRLIGESEQTMSNWKWRGVPKGKHVAISAILDISPLWLAEGADPMRATGQVAPQQLPADEAALLASYRALTEKEKALALLDLKYRADRAALESVADPPEALPAKQDAA